MSLIHEPTSQTRFFCGPLQLSLNADSAELYDKIAETLLLYDFTWPPPYHHIQIDAHMRDRLPAPASGDFLRCARMLVDRHAQGLVATTTSGARAHATFAERSEHWQIEISHNLVQAGKLEEIEDILSLVLTTGWRRDGWTPIHAAAVAKGPACAIICAPTGGGKTTLSAALVRRGWRVLGDDKILLHQRKGEPEIAALLHTFNLHPKTRDWFPEVGDLEVLPRYSAWTEKRKVSVASIWSHAPVNVARPTVLVSLRRRAIGAGFFITPLDQRAVLTALLQQTVIPSEPTIARAIIASVAGAAVQLRGLQIEVATDAYHDARALHSLEEQLEAPA